MLLGLLAHEEADELAPVLARLRGGCEHACDDRDRRDDHAADRVDARSLAQPLEQQPAGEFETARAQHRRTQVEVEVALLPAREHDAALLERHAQDQRQQFAAVGIGHRGGFLRRYCLRMPSAYSAISLVWSSLVPSPNSIALASSSSRPISYSAESP